MSSSSPLGTVELFDVADFADNHPVGARAWRDGPLNNTLHYADQVAQVHVNWSELSSPTEGQDNAVPPGGQGTDSWSLIASSPVKVRLKPDGAPYRLVFGIGGHSQSGNSVDFRIAVSSRDDLETPAYIPNYSLSYSGITSTTSAILTPDGGAAKYLDVGAEVAAPSQRAYSTLSDVGGSPRSVNVCELWVSVWSQYNSTADKGILTHLYVREYYAG